MRWQTIIALDAQGQVIDEAEVIPRDRRATPRRLKRMFAARADVARVVRVTTKTTDGANPHATSH